MFDFLEGGQHGLAIVRDCAFASLSCLFRDAFAGVEHRFGKGCADGPKKLAGGTA